MIQSVGGMNASMASMRMQGPPPKPQEVFDQSDGNADGSLSVDELQDLLDGMPTQGAEKPTAEEFLSQLDTDGDGALSFAEFEAGRPEGPPPGGMPPGGGGMGGGGQGGIDLAQLFAGGEEEDDQLSSLYEALV